MAQAGVVVGVDGSEPAENALAWAADLAEARGETLSAVLVLDPVWSPHGADGPVARGALDRALLSLPAPTRDRVAVEVRRGDTAEQLAAAAGDGLLVVGTHKTGFLRGRVVGSRCLRIAASVCGELAVVPSGASGGRRGVVVGLEPRLDPRATALAAARHARLLGEELVLVHAFRSPPYRGESASSGDADRGRVAARAAARAVADRFPEVAVRMHGSRQRPADAFLDASRSARLLVVGAGEHDRAAAFAGATLHDVVLNVNAPLLVVPIAAGAPAGRIPVGHGAGA